MKPFTSRVVTVGILAAILLLAAALRLAGRNWDQSHLLHPDERFLCMTTVALEVPSSWNAYLDTAHSPLNPHNRGCRFYPYGTLPLFAIRLLSHALSFNSLEDVCLLGRACSALVDVATVLLLFLLGRRLYGRAAGLLAAFLYSICVLPIQQSHFFTVDAWATLCTLAFLLCATWAAARGGVLRQAAAGVLLGLMLATKLSLISFAALALCAVLLPLASAKERWSCRRLACAAAGLAVMAAGALLAFRLANPYAFAGPGFFSGLNPLWLDNLKELSGLVSGRVDFPPALQWADRVRLLFPWWNMVAFGLGPALGLAAWAGWLAEGFSLWRATERKTERFLVWACIPLLLLHLGSQFACSMRYLMPIYPPLLLLGAHGLIRLAEHGARASRAALKNAATLAFALVLLGALAWTVAFTAIYRQPHTRLAASRWLLDHVPAGSAIANEYWDDPLPLRMEPGNNPLTSRYKSLTLTWYDEDTADKLERMLDVLERTDVVVLSSHRLLDSIPRLPMRFPMTTRYYQYLLDGRLGFERVAVFESFPSLGGWRLNDQIAEEAFSVYDHPRVQLFRKTPAWSAAAARRLLGEGIAWDNIPRVPSVRAVGWHNGMHLDAEQQRRVEQGGTWSRQLDPQHGLYDRASPVQRFPVLFWMLAVSGLGLAAFPLTACVLRRLPDRGWLVSKSVGLLLVGSGAWLLANLRQTPLQGHLVLTLLLALCSAVLAWRMRRTHGALWRQRGRLLMLEEGVFWLIFLAFLVLRAGNPDLWHPFRGGEKPMDFAFLQAILKSASWPPYHPWAAGEFINYYYYGFVLMAVPIRLTGLLPEIAYNLAVPTCAALLAAAAFTGAGALSSAFRPRCSGQRATPNDGARRLRAYVMAGLTGVFLSVLAGNLASWQVAGSVSPGDPQWYWNPSRAIPVPAGAVQPITEFPFFTLLFGDLHAHLLAAPFMLLVLVLCIQWLRRPGWPVLLMLALVTGALYPLNAWDYPTSLVLVMVALAIGQWQRHGRDLVRVLLGWCMQFAAVAVAGRVMFLPFFQHFSAPGASFILWQGPRTPLAAQVLIHGLFLLPLAAIGLESLLVRRRFGADGRYLRNFFLLLVALSIALIIAVELVAFGFDVGRMNTVFKFYFQVWLLLSVAVAAALPVLLAPVVPGLATAGAPPFPTLEDQSPVPSEGWKTRCAAGINIVALLAIAVLWSAALRYVLLAVPARWGDRFAGHGGWGLNGAAFMNTARHTELGREFGLQADAAAIRWLQDNVRGSPVVLEGCLPQYRWGGRISIHTGLPTVLGWPWHVLQQRGGLPGETVTQRQKDILRMYTEADTEAARALIRKYAVRYVCFGPLEEILYGEKSRQKLDAGCGSWMELAFRQGDLSIYRVTTEKNPGLAP
jgi:uncharacterized membrane protein/4-amino-4-deoxy-L-arabinose transferase-like glycosyltransferase